MNNPPDMEDDRAVSLVRQHWLIIILAGGGLFCLIFGLLQYSTPKEPVLISDTQETSVNASSTDISVDVAGAVKNPGVYTFQESPRIQDALQKAGGFTDEADIDFVDRVINKAKKMTDGEKLYIPRIGEESETSNNLSDRVNINSASQKELEDLPGIGPVTAQKIIDHRPYASVDELASKDAVSEKTLENIRESVSVY